MYTKISKYKDEETGLVLRKLNYDSKEDIICDVKIIWNYEGYALFPVPFPTELLRYAELGRCERKQETDIHNAMQFLVNDGVAYIANTSVYFYPISSEKFGPVVAANTVSGYEKRLGDCCNATARMLVNQGYKKIYCLVYIYDINKNKILKKKVIEDFPWSIKGLPFEIWEMDV